MKVAVVHDWIMQYGGGERVVEQILATWPDADLYTLVHSLDPEQDTFLNGRVPRTSFIQRLPKAKRNHRAYLPLMPFAVEQFDLSAYDVVISSSSAVAKGVLTGPDQLHVSYVHSPIRYAWDLQHAYLAEAGIGWGPKGVLVRAILHYMRLWDTRTAAGVDVMLANSAFVARRIRKAYGRDAEVLHPPVDVGRFAPGPKEEFYLTASRMVPYKRIPLIVEAFSGMPGKRLLVVGEGPEMDKVKAVAGPNVEILGYRSDAELASLMSKAKAFVFAAEEDFGIAPVEAQAAGTPVIAFGRGGAAETIKGRDGDDPRTGVFFDAQDPESIREAVTRSEAIAFDPGACRDNALRFSADRFRGRMREIVDRGVADLGVAAG